MTASDHVVLMTYLSTGAPQGNLGSRFEISLKAEHCQTFPMDFLRSDTKTPQSLKHPQ